MNSQVTSPTAEEGKVFEANPYLKADWGLRFSRFVSAAMGKHCPKICGWGRRRFQAFKGLVRRRGKL